MENQRPHRHHPGIQKARQWFDDGLIGSVNFIRCRYGIGGRPEYEQEWRILRALQEADKVIHAEDYPIHLFKFPSDAVVEVIFGCRMHESCKQRILRILFKSEIFKDVTVLQAVPDEKEFRIRFNEISV